MAKGSILAKTHQDLMDKLRHDKRIGKRVMAAMEAIKRHEFVPQTSWHLAYEDAALSIAKQQTISQPSLVAYMSEALEIAPTHHILEIGTGSGYQSCILAALARFVYSVERIKSLHIEAESLFKQRKIANIATLWGDGLQGWLVHAPFHRIILTAASDKPPHGLLEQLAEGGILLYPFGEQGKIQHLMKIHKLVGGNIREENLGKVQFVPILQGIRQ